MSRIILDRYPDGQSHIVVGWDHPAQGAFWQEFNQEPEDGKYPDDWEEMLREGGMWPGIPLEKLIDSMPEDLQPLMTPRVMDLLAEHAADPDSGYNKGPIDLTRS
jgi:hypothetical protein